MYYACNGFGCFVDVRVKLTDKLTKMTALAAITQLKKLRTVLDVVR